VSYHPDFSKLGLDWLAKRLNEEDLIPSQLFLREGLQKKLDALRKAGLGNLAVLEAALSTAKKVAQTASTTGIDAEYLKVLGRVLRGYKPKPAPLADYPGIPAKTVQRLAKAGFSTSRDLYEAAPDKAALKALARKTEQDENTLAELLALCTLSRIQWVSPIFARLLHDAGYTSVEAVSRADGETLCAEVDAVNKKKALFKGKIGARDMQRLVYLAKMLGR